MHTGDEAEINPANVQHPEFSTRRWARLDDLPRPLSHLNAIYEAIALEFAIYAVQVRGLVNDAGKNTVQGTMRQTGLVYVTVSRKMGGRFAVTCYMISASHLKINLQNKSHERLKRITDDIRNALLFTLMNYARSENIIRTV